MTLEAGRCYEKNAFSDMSLDQTTHLTKKIYSFDVFDTLMTRCYAKPTDLFYAVAAELRRKNLIDLSVEDWARARIKAEYDTRKKSSFEEITLDEIYETLCADAHLDETLKPQMIETEIEKEIESLCCIDPHSELIKKLRADGNKVIFISDMYLPKAVIKEALSKSGIECGEHELFVSSEYRATKHTGTLFRKVLEELNASPEDMIHTGDSIISDFETPKSMGIESVHFSKFELGRRGQLILNHKQLPYSFKSVVVSCIRLTKLNNHYEDYHKNQIAQISSSVIGPVLYGFVFWILTEAKKKGIQKLYFISRDGQILLKTANEINKALNTGIECSYFYGSRQALHLPAIIKEDIKDLDWLYDDTTFLSVSLLLGRVEINPEELEELLVQSGFSKENWNQNLSKEERKKIRETFNASPEFEQLVLSKAAAVRTLLIAYMKQEGIHAKSKMAFVDIGWNGRLQRSLSKVMHMAGIRPEEGVMGYYFGLIQRSKAFANDTLNAYYYDRENNIVPSYDTSILEKFVEADHGSVLKYTEEKNAIIPLLKDKENKRALEWGLEIQQATTVEFARNLSKNLKSIPPEELYNYANWINLTRIVLQDFCLNPSLDESKVFGSISFSEGQNDHAYHRLVKPLSFKNCLTILNNGTHDAYNGLWVAGSMMLTKKGRFFKKLKELKGEAAQFFKGNKTS